MDWHKLQQTLFSLDPTDPREDLARLRAAAQGAPQKTISEPVDYLNESARVPEGSLKMDRDYSVADFAALAGVRIDERQKHGDYARGNSPMPKAEPGRTKHPLKDKLVGEDEIDEGPIDAVKQGVDAFKQGFSNYNTLGAVKQGTQAMGQTPAPKTASPEKAKPQQIQGSLTGAQLGKQLGVSDPNMFNQAVMKVKQGQPLSRMHQAAMSDAFIKLMAMDPQETQRTMQLLKRIEAKTEAVSKPKSKEHESIKEHLYRLLNNKK